MQNCEPLQIMHPFFTMMTNFLFICSLLFLPGENNNEYNFDMCVCVVQVTFGPFGQYMYGLEGARTVDSRFSLMVSCSTEDGLEAPRGKEKKALGLHSSYIEQM